MLNSLSPNDHERVSRVAALGVSVSAAALCLYLLVRIAWLLLARGGDAAVPVPNAAPATAAPAVSIAQWHLFGNPQGLAHARTGPALATVLKLGLRGTLALPDPKDERAIAIIADEQGAEASYRIGATVAPHATLAEVYADHVVLDHEGVAETLELPRPEQHAPPLPAANQARLDAAAAPAASNPHLPRGIIGSAPAAATPRTIDANAFASQIRPVFANGKLVGADISGADAGLLARVGLKPTDVVTAINGTPLASVSNPQALIDELQNRSSIQVTVQRDGRPATLTLSLR